MNKNVKINLYSARGKRQIDITPKGFPTRHIRTGKPTETPKLAITLNSKPVLPAYKKAWNDNRQRVIDFLSEGFNLNESTPREELNAAIREQYAPQKERTPAQWHALTDDLKSETWTWGHWIFDLKHRLWHKYERVYSGTPLTDENVITVMHAIHETYGFQWILFDEILKVATVSFKIKTEHKPLRGVLRELREQGRIEYKASPSCPRSKQYQFRLLREKQTLHVLLAEVDGILGTGRSSS